MKKFAGTKPLFAIEQQCKAQGVYFDSTLFRKRGFDTVVVGGPVVLNKSTPRAHCWVIFNTFNGHFWGHTPAGVEFDSSSAEHEKEPWFQALLSFFYVEKDRPGAAPKATTMVDYTRGAAVLLD